ncbi:MAG: cysteine synthase family protein [Planctomycetes bacterium]|nr:cysteine synthase family protein [Planctomycetota bacterium]
MQETAASFSDRNPIRRVLPLVGNTPLLELEFALDERGPRRIFAKLETLNFTGSIKDRMALHVLGSAYERGAIEPGAEIIEATSGNTGISFAALGRALGHPVRIYIPAWMSEERLAILRGFGAEVVPVSHEQGGFLGSIRMAEERAEVHAPSFLPRQFSNEANVEAHELGTGREILRQLVHVGLKPTAFVAGVGTGGTVMGVGRTLKRFDPAIRVHPLEPASSPVLTAKKKVGKHRIQGISDEFIPPIVHLDELDRIVAVDDGDAILMAQRLARELGLGVGISAGANVIGALRLAAELGPDAVVVTVLCDSNKKYLSTDLFREEPVREGYLAPHAHPRRVRAL